MSDPSTVLAGPPRRRRGARPRNLTPYLLIVPFAVVIVGFLIYPLCDAIYLSLTRWNMLTSASPTFVGPSTFGRLFQDAVFWSSLGRTCIWTVGTLLVEYAVGFPLALALNYRTRLTGLATGLMLLPWVTPTVVCAYAWTWILNSQYGFLYALLHSLHLFGSMSPLASYDSALPMVTVVSGWKGVPYMAVALLAALKAIPVEQYEAARIDGASVLGLHRYITLPAVRATAIVIGLLLGIGAFYSFDFAWLMTNGGPGDATQLTAIYLFKTFQYDMKWSYAANIGMAMFAILGVAVIIYLRIARPNAD